MVAGLWISEEGLGKFGSGVWKTSAAGYKVGWSSSLKLLKILRGQMYHRGHEVNPGRKRTKDNETAWWDESHQHSLQES